MYGGADELHRGGPVQTIREDREGAVGEGVELGATSTRDVDEERAARGDFGSGGRLWPERDHAAVLRQVGTGPACGRYTVLPHAAVRLAAGE